MQRYSADGVDDGTLLVLTWEIDGRETRGDQQHVHLTRRIRVKWASHDGVTQMIYLVYVAPKPLRQTNSDAYAASAKGTHFLGRGLVEPSEKQSLIKSWIDLCVDGHNKDDSECGKMHGSPQDFKALIGSTHFGVIDVVDMSLKGLPVDAKGNPERYVALSYVWGKRPPVEETYRTVMSNVMLHIQHGGIEKIWNRLPRTIQHCILLVSRLGERYLWIDSLCIVQDSISSWELNARAMHLVYGNAYLTICAADGDAETGLMAVAPMLQPTSPIGLAHPEIGEKVGLDRPHRPLTAECVAGVTLLVSRPPEVIIRESAWNKRGWTFQERLLSPRCLVFAEGQVFFQCRSSVISEDVFTDGAKGGWSLDASQAPLRTLGELKRRAFWFYMWCIRMYTGRELSHPKDILTAFQGTSRLLQQHLNSPLLYGLPTSHFDMALLWNPVCALRRRRKQQYSSLNRSACSQDELGNCTCKHQEDTYGKKQFPSWSWCGWIGGNADYQSEMIEACLLNVREWLLNHTWIQWHFRDEQGNLRPVWDKHALIEDNSEEARWRGYHGRSTRRGIVTTAAMTPAAPVLTHQKETMGPSRSLRPFRSLQRAAENVDTRWSPRTNAQFINSSFIRTRGPAHIRNSDSYHDRPHYLDQYPNSPPHLQILANNPFVAPVTWGQYTHPGVYHYEYPPPPVVIQQSHAQHHGPRLRPLTVVHELTTSDEDSSAESWESAQETLSDEDNGGPSEPRSSTISASEAVDEHDGIYVRESSHKRAENPPQDSTSLDSYGRPRRYPRESATTFTKIIPENPFAIIRGPFSKEQQKDDHARAMPILQFFTWQTWLYVQRSPTLGPLVAGEGLARYDILDQAGNWCGSIKLPDDGGQSTVSQETPQSFIALSDAKAFTKEECPTWNYYIPKERDESDWDLYYVLLLQRHLDRGLWERVALGKVFKAAFHPQVARWKEIKLG